MNETTTHETTMDPIASVESEQTLVETEETAQVDSGESTEPTEVSEAAPIEESSPEQVDREEPPSAEPTATTTWQDVAAASAEAQREEPAEEYVTDVLQVKVTDVALAKIARDNAADDLEKQQLEGELETLKEDVKAKKAEIDAIEKRMSERHEAVRTGVQSLKGEWRVVEIFETNTLRYVDPETGLVVHERPMTASERQQDLFSRCSPPQTSALAPTDAFPESEEASVDGEDADDESSDTEDEAARVEGEDATDAPAGEGDARDHGPLCARRRGMPACLCSNTEAKTSADEPDASDDDDVAIDATSILEAAMAPAEPQLSEPPSKPTRRGRKKAE